MFIDVHCHLDGQTYGDLGEMLSECGRAGVGAVIAVGFDVPSSVFAKECAEKFPQVYFAAGLHPTELKNFKQSDLDVIADLCAHPKCVALGEIGLDYHYEDTRKELQSEVFTAQLELAARLNMPVQIHSRDSAEDTLNLLKDKRELLKSGALMHCYSYSAELAAQFLKLGVSFSFGGASTWKGSKRAKKVIASLPLSALMTETDSPYMPPKSLYGSFPNTPKSIVEIAGEMASIRGISVGELEKSVLNNALSLFKKLKAEA